MPVLIFKGSPRDVYHPRKIGEEIHRLIPHSELIDPPWTEAEFFEHWIAVTKTGAGHLSQWQRLAEPILAFLDR